jgi:hypothetical protein
MFGFKKRRKYSASHKNFSPVPTAIHASCLSQFFLSGWHSDYNIALRWRPGKDFL